MTLDTEIYRRVVNAKMYMDDNLHDPIGLDEVSKQACFSPFHFHRLFTRIYRKTPHEYLTQVRIDAAKQMLSKAKMSIAQVCNNVGFESPGSFSTLFKKKNGMSPQEYRNKEQERQKAVEDQPRCFIPHCLFSHFTGEK